MPPHTAAQRPAMLALAATRPRARGGQRTQRIAPGARGPGCASASPALNGQPRLVLRPHLESRTTRCRPTTAPPGAPCPRRAVLSARQRGLTNAAPCADRRGPGRRAAAAGFADDADLAAARPGASAARRPWRGNWRSPPPLGPTMGAPAPRRRPGRLRAQFPQLAQNVNGAPLAYLDNAATTQMPLAVLDALRGFDAQARANIHRGVHPQPARHRGLRGQARATLKRLSAPAPSTNWYSPGHHRVAQPGGARPVGPRRAPPGSCCSRATRSSSAAWSTTPTCCPGRARRSGAGCASCGPTPRAACTWPI